METDLPVSRLKYSTGAKTDIQCPKCFKHDLYRDDVYNFETRNFEQIEFYCENCGYVPDDEEISEYLNVFYHTEHT